MNNPIACSADPPSFGREASSLFRRCASGLLILLTAAGIVLGAHATGAEKPKTELGEQMEQMSKSLRLLSRQAADPSKRESSFALLAAILKNAETAKTLVPAKAKEIPEVERDQYVADFQKKMDELIGEFRKLETAVRDSKKEEITAILSGLRKIKREGHEKFSSEEEK